MAFPRLFCRWTESTFLGKSRCWPLQHQGRASWLCAWFRRPRTQWSRSSQPGGWLRTSSAWNRCRGLGGCQCQLGLALELNGGIVLPLWAESGSKLRRLSPISEMATFVFEVRATLQWFRGSIAHSGCLWDRLCLWFPVWTLLSRSVAQGLN